MKHSDTIELTTVSIISTPMASGEEAMMVRGQSPTRRGTLAARETVVSPSIRRIMVAQAARPVLMPDTEIGKPTVPQQVVATMKVTVAVDRQAPS